MKWLERFIYLFFFLAIACANNFPRKDYSVIKYVPDETCLWYKQEDEYLRTCPGEVDYPETVMAISVLDYTKELKYQELLIKSCKRWR